MRRLGARMAVVVLGLLLVPAGAAGAQTGYGEDETPRGEILLIDAGEGDFDEIVAPGAYVRLKAGGFMPESNVVVELHSEVRTLAFEKTDDAGNLDATVQIPEDAPHGEHTLVAVGIGPDGEPHTVEVGIEIGDPEAGDGNGWLLPTGVTVAMVAVAAIAVQVAARRRRSAGVSL